MRFIGLLLAIGMVISCGTDTSYTRTLANEESPQQETGKSSSKVLTITGVGVGVIVATCVAVNLKKRCVPFVKKITRIGENGKTKKTEKAEQRSPSSDSPPQDTARTKPDSEEFDEAAWEAELRQAVKTGELSEEESEAYMQFVEESRKLYEAGEISKEDFDLVRNRKEYERHQEKILEEREKRVESIAEEQATWAVFLDRGKELLDMRLQKEDELADGPHLLKLEIEGRPELTAYKKKIARKATEELVQEGKMTAEDAETLSKYIAVMNDNGANLIE